MAIAFGAASGGNSNGGVNSISSASITVTGSNTKGFAYAMSAEDDVTGATWNGVAMTLVDKQVGIDNVSLYYLDSPATGVVTVNRSGTAGRIQVSGAYYTGCASGAPNAFSKTVNGPGATTVTGTVSATITPSWAVMVGYFNGGYGSVGAGSTERNVQAIAGGIFDTNGNASVPQSMTINVGAGDNEVVIATFHELGAVSSAKRLLTLMRVG